MQDWKLEFITPKGSFNVEWDDFEKWKDETIPVEEFVPRKAGEAVYFTRILNELSVNGDFSFATFTAADGFEQKVPKNELNQAFLLFKQKGEPLKKSFPVRLYVPGNESDCLNVKSVVKVFLHE